MIESDALRDEARWSAWERVIDVVEEVMDLSGLEPASRAELAHIHNIAEHFSGKTPLKVPPAPAWTQTRAAADGRPRGNDLWRLVLPRSVEDKLRRLDLRATDEVIEALKRGDFHTSDDFTDAECQRLLTSCARLDSYDKRWNDIRRELNEAGIPRIATYKLASCGINLQQSTLLSDEDLLSIDGIGAKTVAALRAATAESTA